ncbi:4-(cytidine 5'-diphospho)-2-C-methyl-D-erythritol kinase [Sulfuriroseicoccus oceanibius]|uniref:4-diphosphocytidyl-2-C-methyl-D-erythritol kinase n=1 Tax=Sulfuriroseicoccus oceanibius TaxID=2707525 RepID=A0A6B3L841_9BACT|nr:4-(cytidine 5'-diphospho)-2-C-methyl-D-erythritol kinase [Sulfuriroseicoccus oceanibius]QQL44793.1 4-(cytidine 5'-diphospho)-2-C-methyl-D-erythritol kinase [Sulfuriroseicoccus oceanibius]
MSDSSSSPVFPYEVAAHAKINLDLSVLGKREDGFHEISSTMTGVSLFDTLVFEPGDEGEGPGLVIDGADDLPVNDDNLVIRAAKLFAERTGKAADFNIRLIKRVPSGAGLGGGSSDAAATLRALNDLTGAGLGEAELAGIAGEIGSDIPFFIYGGVCRVGGRGEVVEPINFDWELPVLLIKPGFGVETPDAYKRWITSQELESVLYAPQICPWGPMVNSLERPVFEKYPVLADMKMWLLDQGETHAALMSGSGSTMIAVLAQQHVGGELLRRAKERYGDTLWGFVGHTLSV